MNVNGFDRWASVFSAAARSIVGRHLENGGLLQVDDPTLGLTVERFRAGLTLACPGEPLPSDDVLRFRLQLLEVMMSRQKLKDALAAANEIGRGVLAELEAASGDSMGYDPFDDG